jgi:hypothetical protein
VATQTATGWRLKGTVTLACNCDYGCPCNFNALPTQGHCEGEWNWHVEQGSYGDTRLDGLNFTVACDWPGAIHEGSGEAVVLIDERADDAQREAIQALVDGQNGGPWAIISTTLVKVSGPLFVPYEVKLDGIHSEVRAGNVLELVMEPIRNRTTGAESHPRILLPQGFIYKDAAIASSKSFRVQDGISYDHSGKYAAVSLFEYSGPK